MPSVSQIATRHAVRSRDAFTTASNAFAEIVPSNGQWKLVEIPVRIVTPSRSAARLTSSSKASDSGRVRFRFLRLKVSLADKANSRYRTPEENARSYPVTFWTRV